MNKNEQVSALAKIICNFNRAGFADSRKMWEYTLLASHLYNRGYRKVPKGEWVFKEYGENSHGNLTRIYECSLCGRTIECSMEADEVYCHCGAMNIRED